MAAGGSQYGGGTCSSTECHVQCESTGSRLLYVRSTVYCIQYTVHDVIRAVYCTPVLVHGTSVRSTYITKLSGSRVHIVHTVYHTL